MATCYITEYADAGAVSGHVIGIGKEPRIANQTVAITTVTSSSAFNSKTKFIRVHVDAICSIDIGTTPTATTAMCRLAANQTEYFAVKGGDKISVITNT